LACFGSSEVLICRISNAKNGKFKLAKQKNIEKATKAMYEVIRRGKRHNLSIECLLDLFDKIVKPILLYGCEVWGFSNNYVIEKNHLEFCKLILFPLLITSYMSFVAFSIFFCFANLNFPVFVKVTRDLNN
jgi:hypothetical protein